MKEEILEGQKNLDFSSIYLYLAEISRCADTRSYLDNTTCVLLIFRLKINQSNMSHYD